VESLGVYVPMDRRQALAQGLTLPDRVQGTALFADISGFTPLTEALVHELGPQRGAEELTRHLNLVFDALIDELYRYGGSVIGFSGDAITCWLDGDAGVKATACALIMQQRMQHFAQVAIPSGTTVSLAMKTAVATGAARRFVVGDPQIHLIDVLAGATLDRLALAEHHAGKGEVVLDPLTAAALGDRVEFAAWRYDPGTGERFGLVRQVIAPVAASSWPPLPAGAHTQEQLRPWLLPPVYERLQAGQGEFLAEFRPTVSLFVRFSGIDYDADEAAGKKLDAFVRWLQTVLVRYEGHLLSLSIGDKGSYLFASFGAPIVHEDDAVRAVSAALEIQALPPELDFIKTVQTGITHGRLWTGAYGGTMRRTYGVMGDDVNLAARLMQAAAPGQILASQAVQQASANTFVWQDLPTIKVKGKAEPVTVFSPLRVRRRASDLREPEYALPLVGRTTELGLLQDKAALALQGQGQIVGITGEAGIGKTRLVAEAIRIARERQMIGYSGECESYGTHTSYLVWRPIWRAFFDLDPAWEIEEQIGALEHQLQRIDSNLTSRLPLLGAALNLTIPDNDLTRSFDAKLRKESLEALLVDCLRARAQESPLLLILEDCHWLDPLSHDLLEVVGHAVADLPILMVMAYRPPEAQRLRESRRERDERPRLSQLDHFSEIRLSDFTPQEAERLIALKLRQFFGYETVAPAALVDRITARAEGNPFYIEELLNYLRDKDISPQDTPALAVLDLPASLHTLVLSRLDQRTESQKITLRVASVIGRLFRAALLWGTYPELGPVERVKADLEALCRLDLTVPDSPEPELTYLFRHIVTQEVAYESLPYATRAMLHEQLAQYIERTFGGPLDQYVDLLAFHYERSQNAAKKREYLLKAGEAAQKDYANEAAIDYYQRLLPLLSAEEQVAVTLKLGEVLQLVGKWQTARERFEQAEALAEKLGDRQAQAGCQTALAELLRKQGLYAEASEWLRRARAVFEDLHDQKGVAQALHYSGSLAAQQGDYAAARACYQGSLSIRRELDDKPRIAALLSNLGIVARYEGDYALARSLHEEGLAIRREMGDKRAIAVSLNNLGNVALDQGDYAAARMWLGEAVALQREVGDRHYLALALNNLGNVARFQGDYDTARTMYEQSLSINRALGDKWAIAYLLEDFGCLAALQRQAERALRLAGAAEALREAIGAPRSPAEQDKLERILEPARQTLGEAAAAVAEAGRVMSLEQAVAVAAQVG